MLLPICLSQTLLLAESLLLLKQNMLISRTWCAHFNCLILKSFVNTFYQLLHIKVPSNIIFLHSLEVLLDFLKIHYPPCKCICLAIICIDYALLICIRIWFWSLYSALNFSFLHHSFMCFLCFSSLWNILFLAF